MKNMAIWTIEINIEWASENTLAETEKIIDDYVNDIPWFIYTELSINQINKNKTFKLKSANSENIKW